MAAPAAYGRSRARKPPRAPHIPTKNESLFKVGSFGQDNRMYHRTTSNHNSIWFFWGGVGWLVLFFRAPPEAHGVSQASDPIGAVAAGLNHSHSNLGSQPCLRSTPQLTAMPDPYPTEQGQGLNPNPSGCQSGSLTTEQRRELLTITQWIDPEIYLENQEIARPKRW